MTRWLYLSLALTLLAFGGSLALWFVPALYERIPDQVPTHWNMAGQADGFTPKQDVWLTFLLIPGVMAAIVLLTLVLPWLSPRRFDLDRFRPTYEYIMFLVTAMAGYIHFASIMGGMQTSLDTTRLVLGGICLFLALVGNVLGKVQRNFYVGVRTPWTLASEAVWVRTHRLAAWLMTAGGLVGFVLILAGVPFYYAFIVIMVTALLPVPYSLWVYKQLERQGKLEPSADPSPEGPSQEVHAG
jgi:uncharacterized membrane protein